ncbi:Putative IS481 family integrase [Candidatus Bealeia paramacronuclearis]|uniref:IS481 family integrase n=1 Tax=Candidatus Bealeia paramacronuclearis TaxID=1921001 RepID=A0ABZ2C1Z1_9PROT|nr:putative IS481 family integrase [Candidatus Bealeia paramacronuclearis]
MQIKGLHKNMHRLYAYARTQDCLDVYRQRYSTSPLYG